MAAANLNVRPDIASGIVAQDATNLVLLFPLDRIPVSTHRLLCHWHPNSDGRLSCRWEPNKSSDRAFSIRKNLSNRFVNRDGSNIGSG
jgi:hypothetical protein